jgi:uncharacterized zinc-type alcohol dehydrogenase-like protein
MTKTEAKAGTFPSKAFAAQSATSELGPFTVQRRPPRADDVQIEILYCGVCHSDLHTVRNEWSAIMIAKELFSKVE